MVNIFYLYEALNVSPTLDLWDLFKNSFRQATTQSFWSFGKTKNSVLEVIPRFQLVLILEK